MKSRVCSDEEIRSIGLKALLRDPGPDGLIRFLRQFCVGGKNYTRDRCLLLPDGDLDELLADMKGYKTVVCRGSSS